MTNKSFGRKGMDCCYFIETFIPLMLSISKESLWYSNIILDVGNIYLIQDTCLEVTCCITKNDGTLPDKSVGTVNNLLHSMFESVRLTINDISTSFRVLCAPESWSKYSF